MECEGCSGGWVAEGIALVVVSIVGHERWSPVQYRIHIKKPTVLPRGIHTLPTLLTLAPSSVITFHQ